MTAKHTLTPRRPFEIPALEDLKIPAFDLAWLAKQSAEPAIVWPLPGANPRVPATWVVVKHLPEQRVALTVDGVLVDPLSFDGTDVDREHGVAVTRYRNVPIDEGDNRIEVRLITDASETTLDGRVHSPAHRCTPNSCGSFVSDRRRHHAVGDRGAPVRPLRRAGAPRNDRRVRRGAAVSHACADADSGSGASHRRRNTTRISCATTVSPTWSSNQRPIPAARS